MRRIVRGAALVAACAIVTAGCEAGQAARESSTAALTADVLTEQDMPPGFLAAGDQEVFGRLKPGDPDCRRLLALADLSDLRDAPSAGSRVPAQAHAVFYRTDPGSTLAERLVVLSPERALSHIGEMRRAAAGCPQIRIGRRHGYRRVHERRRAHRHRHRHAGRHGVRPGAGARHGGRSHPPRTRVKVLVEDRLLPLRRIVLDLPALGANAYGVRYAGRVGPHYSIHYDMIVAQFGARLLVLEQPVLIDRRNRSAGDHTSAIAATALSKLRGVTSARPSAGAALTTP